MEGSVLHVSAGLHPGTGSWPPETPCSAAAFLHVTVSATWDHFIATSLRITRSILITQSSLQMQWSKPELIYSGIKQIKRCKVAVNGKLLQSSGVTLRLLAQQICLHIFKTWFCFLFQTPHHISLLKIFFMESYDFPFSLMISNALSQDRWRTGLSEHHKSLKSL